MIDKIIFQKMTRTAQFNKYKWELNKMTEEQTDKRCLYILHLVILPKVSQVA
jgi:hypothetical protein